MAEKQKWVLQYLFEDEWYDLEIDVPSKTVYIRRPDGGILRISTEYGLIRSLEMIDFTLREWHGVPLGWDKDEGD